MRQLPLFPLPPSKSDRARDKKDRNQLAAILRRAALPPICQKTGLSRRQLKLLMRPLPKITVPR